MSLLNAFLAVVFDLLLAPFRQLPPIVGLAVVSLLTAIAMLLIFKRTSNQTRLTAVKRPSMSFAKKSTSGRYSHKASN